MSRRSNGGESAVLVHALSNEEEEHGPEYPGLASLLIAFGNFYRTQKKYKEAESLYMRALTIQEQNSDAHPVGIAAALHGLAELYEEQDNFQEAVFFYRRALVICENAPGFSHSQTISTRKRLYTLLDQMGQSEERMAPNLALENQVKD